MQPRQIRETSRPVAPSFVYSMDLSVPHRPLVDSRRGPGIGWTSTALEVIASRNRGQRRSRPARTPRTRRRTVVRLVTPAEAPSPDRRRWLILAVIGIAQLMVILDNSIVNIALPSAQADLGFDDAQRQWIVTAYALAFGSLLLLGGRLSDLFGRKRAFLVGL